MKPNGRYEVVLYWSDDDEAFIAEVPELPGARRTELLIKIANGTQYSELWRSRAPKTAETVGFPRDGRWRGSSGIMAESPPLPDIDHVSRWKSALGRAPSKKSREFRERQLLLASFG